jgi:glyoxylase-like metal-dependent hydrolase (beta-lactamase superfamily II)
VLKDGDRVDAVGGLIVYHTPGHTPGHVAFYQPEHKWIFTGDLFFGDGKRLVLTTPDYTLHTPTAQISARRVSQLAIESVFSYHGGPVLKNGAAAVRAVVDGF